VKTTARTLLIALTAVLATTSCETTNKPPRGYDNEALVTGRLAQVNPVDVVVLPIDNRTERTDLPLEALRAQFHAGLVKRRYSPLGLEYVDARAVEAAYQPGSLQEQGVFQVSILEWNDRSLETHGRLEVLALVHLLDASGGSGEALWGGTVTRKVDVNLERATAPGTRLPELAASKFVEDVLASLPPRDPRR
jgi:hypothetical protein